jgi:glyoxylase-like metal-dependent hydrolase (beta-lactamase superfamily II)
MLIKMRNKNMPATIFAALVSLALLSGMSRDSAAAPRVPRYQVFAIRYATVPAFPVRHLVAGADTSRRTDIAMMFWLLEGPGGRRVLVDAGFYAQKFLDDWKPAGFVRPDEAVRRFGVAPEAITDVIISHIHWDHAGGADLFPKARVWLQREEYDYYVGAAGEPLHDAIDSLDSAMLHGLHRAGRVRLAAGDSVEILPGITVYTGGKHTYASQYVGVNTPKGTVVVASDNLYLYENLDRRVAIAQTLDAASNLAAQDRMKRLAASPRLIVPGHDPAVFARFRMVKPGVVKIE